VRKLREYGYIEGQNVRFVSRFAEGRDDRYPAMAAELAALSLDLIVTWGTPAALAAKQATRTIPVVMAAIGDHKSKDCFHHGLDRSADAHCSRRRGN
jgi:putative ABC transport system substrate-binding protein